MPKDAYEYMNGDPEERLRDAFCTCGGADDCPYGHTCGLEPALEDHLDYEWVEPWEDD